MPRAVTMPLVAAVRSAWAGQRSFGRRARAGSSGAEIGERRRPRAEIQSTEAGLFRGAPGQRLPPAERRDRLRAHGVFPRDVPSRFLERDLAPLSAPGVG